jgi:peptide-methionine (S)-S-oxide reductase
VAATVRARSLLVLVGVGVTAAAPPAAAQRGAATAKTETAVFAGGCFWGVDAVFRHVRGVTGVVSGYAGGGAATARYDLVSTSTTGHAESVEVTFDPARVSYDELLRVFFTVAHDPTERDRQGPDVGSQYRSVVFYHTTEQHAAAVAMIAALERERTYPRPIMTEVVPLARFYPAEAYHQDYLAHHTTSPYIVYNDLPKLKRLEERFPKLYQRP